MRRFYVFEKGKDEPLTVWGWHSNAVESARWHSRQTGKITVVIADRKPLNPQVIYP